MAFEKVYTSGKISYKHAFLVKEMLRKLQEWIINIALTFLKSKKKMIIFDSHFNKFDTGYVTIHLVVTNTHRTHL